MHQQTAVENTEEQQSATDVSPCLCCLCRLLLLLLSLLLLIRSLSLGLFNLLLLTVVLHL